VVAWNDHEALSLLRTLHRAGVRVPEEVSLVGYDALPEGAMVHPALTTVDPQVDGQLQAALTLLRRSIAPPASHSTVIVPSIVVRESSAAPRR
jgi:DNA-binding LacI/PurR family transcriptional regulator